MAESKHSMLLQRIVGIIISRPNKFSNNSSKNNNNNSCNNNNSSSYNNNDNNCNNSSSRSIWRHSLKPKDSNRSLRFYFFRNLAAEFFWQIFKKLLIGTEKNRKRWKSSFRAERSSNRKKRLLFRFFRFSFKSEIFLRNLIVRKNEIPESPLKVRTDF